MQIGFNRTLRTRWQVVLGLLAVLTAGQASAQCLPGQDPDGDGHADAPPGSVDCPLDNCPGLFNPAQLDPDADGLGTGCDPCPLTPGPGSGLDDDADGVDDGCDNCPGLSSLSQLDIDGDGLGAPCDDDDDGDGWPDQEDVCPEVADPGQEDWDGDGHGDACSACGDAELFRPVPNEAGQKFAISVDVLGDRVVMTESGSQDQSVKVYTYVRDGGRWVAEAPLETLLSTPELLVPVALTSGAVETMALGIPASSANGGVVQVFHRGAEAWELVDQLGPDPDAWNFGTYLALDGNRMAVTNATQAAIQGDVYVYERPDEASAFELVQALPRPADVRTTFGDGLSLSGDWLTVADSLALSVHAYRYVGGSWILAQTFEGSSASLQGAHLLVGDRDANDQVGLVRSFDLVGATWLPTGEWAPQGPTQERFGWRIDMDDGLAVIGSPRSGRHGLDAGAAWIFGRNADRGDWSLLRRVLPHDFGAFDQVGESVALHDGTVVLGSPWHEHRDTGAAYVLDLEVEDPDADGIPDACDTCPEVFDPSNSDRDGDGRGDLCDSCPDHHDVEPSPDSDADGHGEACDNCPEDANADQLDSDGDGFGDACDLCPFVSSRFRLDRDEDGVGDECDNCPRDANPDQSDVDGDSLGDACDPCPESRPDEDADGDRILDACDNCPTVVNFSQANWDDDSHGNHCDNCIEDSNEDQADHDGDGIGDACDSCREVSAIELSEVEPLTVRRDPEGLRLDWELRDGELHGVHVGQLDELWRDSLLVHEATAHCSVREGWTVVEEPASNVYYLVVEACGPGDSSSGRDSLGRERRGADPPCR